MKENYLPGNKGELVINGKNYPVDTPQIIKYTSSYHVISHKLNLFICSPDLLMFVNFGTSDKVNLDVLEIGYIFRVGEAGSPCFFDLTVFSENFSGSSSGGQIKVLENDVSRNLLCLEFIDISVLSDTPGCGRGNISGCVTIIYEKLEQKW